MRFWRNCRLPSFWRSLLWAVDPICSWSGVSLSAPETPGVRHVHRPLSWSPSSALSASAGCVAFPWSLKSPSAWEMSKIVWVRRAVWDLIEIFNWPKGWDENWNERKCEGENVHSPLSGYKRFLSSVEHKRYFGNIHSRTMEVSGFQHSFVVNRSNEAGLKQVKSQ